MKRPHFRATSVDDRTAETAAQLAASVQTERAEATREKTATRKAVKAAQRAGIELPHTPRTERAAEAAAELCDLLADAKNEQSEL